jgi:UDP-glucose 4-epimerase
MERKAKRAVVTGGAGFIGSHLVDALVAKGYSVDVIDNLSGGKKERVNPMATLHVCDITEYDQILPIISGADVVFHLAALPRVQYSIEEPQITHTANAIGTLNVLHAVKEGGAKKFIYSASSSAYGDNETLPLHEDLPARPLSPYALQKFIGEEYARMYHFLHGTQTVSLRYFNVYGSRLDPNGPYALVIGLLLRLRKEGKPLTMTGDGEQTRDFTHVRDVVWANILAAESNRVGKGEVINIGSGRNFTMNKLGEMIGGEVVHIPSRKEPRHTRADNRKAKELLGWEPQVTLEEGIAELLQEWGF